MHTQIAVLLTAYLLDSNLAAITTGPIPNCQGVVKDYDIPGHDVQFLGPIDMEGCCNACKERTFCKAWTWSMPFSACWLKDSVGTMVYNRNALALYSGNPGSRLGGEGFCHGVVQGLDISPASNDILPSFPNSNLDACCKACNNNFACKGWVLSTQDNTCFLKSVDTPWVPSSTRISALPGYIDQGRCSGRVNNFDTAPGSNDISSSFPTLLQENCCGQCLDNTACQAYVWNGNTCFLKSAVGPRVERPPASGALLRSGIPTRGRALATRCFGITSGLDVSPGSNDLVPSIPNSSFDACCDACNNNRQCKAWVLNVQDNTCFLKSASQPWVVSSTRVSALKSCVGVARSYDTAPGQGKEVATLTLVNSLDSCCQSCRDNTACQAFTYDEANHLCFLKSVTGPRVFSPSSAFQSLTTGLATGLVQGASGCYAVSPGLNISPGSGDLYTKTASSLDACCDECRFNKDCKGFVFNLATQNCFIKSLDDNWQMDSSVTISGLPRSAVRVDNSQELQ